MTRAPDTTFRSAEDPGDRVNEIRDAILADALDAVGGLPVPESYRAVLVRKDEQDMFAGEPVIPFYPLVQVIGATPCDGTYGRDGQPSVQRCFWKDHKGTGWAVSGDSFFDMYFYYPLSPDFWWPPNDHKNPGDCVAWLPATRAFSPPRFADSGGATIDYRRPDQIPAAQRVLYTTSWPQDLPILKVGETLTFPGGEYHLDNPTTTVTSK